MIENIAQKKWFNKFLAIHEIKYSNYKESAVAHYLHYGVDICHNIYFEYYYVHEKMLLTLNEQKTIMLHDEQWKGLPVWNGNMIAIEM